MIYTLKNDVLTVKVESHGAEVKSVVSNENGREYMWQGDKKYWGGTSPILFPSIGSMKNMQYKYNGKIYPMTKHGFARDKDFEVISQTETEIWFQIKEDEETLKIYPFHFTLQLGYELKGNEVAAHWKVVNDNDVDMYFCIGGHPAFNCPIHGEDSKEAYALRLNANGKVLYSGNDENGLMLNAKEEFKLTDGKAYMTDGFFDEVTYMIEDYQVSEVSVVEPNGNAYATVKFRTPVIAFWSPEKKNAPFVCIEPWFGRGDCETFNGTLEERAHSVKLAPRDVFTNGYEMIFN